MEEILKPLVLAVSSLILLQHDNVCTRGKTKAAIDGLSKAGVGGSGTKWERLLNPSCPSLLIPSHKRLLKEEAVETSLQRYPSTVSLLAIASWVGGSCHDSRHEARGMFSCALRLDLAIQIKRCCREEYDH